MRRLISTIIIICLTICIPGCNEPQGPSLTDNININQLAPQGVDNLQQTQLQTLNFELQICELPADELNNLDEIRTKLSVMPFRYNNRLSFSENFFSVYIGGIQSLGTVRDILTTKYSSKNQTMTIIIEQKQEETLIFNRINNQMVVFYTSSTGTKEGARIGPGALGLRLFAEKNPSDNIISLTAYPVFSEQRSNTIPELNAKLQSREFLFTSAAFGVEMGIGDFILIAPETYRPDQPNYLGSLFFNNPAGSLFYNPNTWEAPTLKPSVKVYILICTGINIT